jgi:hypothetical protein
MNSGVEAGSARATHKLSNALSSAMTKCPAASTAMTDRRNILDDLDPAGQTRGAARPTAWAADRAAMHEATRVVGAKETVSKRSDSPYRAGRSWHWLNTKHKLIETFQVAGWRPSTPARPGGLILAEAGEPVGVATLPVPATQRAALVDLMGRYGRRHATGAVTIPDDRLQAVVHYTSRTPTHGRLREVFVMSIEPSESTLP